MKTNHVATPMILAITIFALFNSCTSTGFLMAKPKVTMFTNPYLPQNASAKIDVYQTNMPNCEYVEIAEISCSDTNNSWNMQQILLKAREIGADGVIIIGKAGSYAVGVPVGNMVVAAGESYGIKAVAIVYKN